MLQFSHLRFDELSSQALYDIMMLRQSVFVVEQNCPYLDADGLDQVAIHILARDKEARLTAYARIFEKGAFYDDYLAIGRICTSPNHRNKGYGQELVQYCLSFCEHQFPSLPIKISAQEYLERFYKSFGFKSVGKGYLEDGIAHIAMVKEKRAIAIR